MYPNSLSPFYLEAERCDQQFLFHEQETVCFSGHRSKFLPVDPVDGVDSFHLIQVLLALLIEQAIADGYRYFINGGSEGIDLWAASYVLQKIESGRHDLHLVTALPAPNHVSLFHGETRELLLHVMEHSDAVIYVSRARTGDYNLVRNAYMVKHASRLIAVIRNSRSGTGNTIRQAQHRGLTLRLINFRSPGFSLSRILWEQPALRTITELSQCGAYYNTQVSRDPEYQLSFCTTSY